MKTALETSEETLKVTLVEVCSFVSVSNFKFVISKTQNKEILTDCTLTSGTAGWREKKKSWFICQNNNSVYFSSIPHILLTKKDRLVKEKTY